MKKKLFAMALCLLMVVAMAQTVRFIVKWEA